MSEEFAAEEFQKAKDALEELLDGTVSFLDSVEGVLH